MNLGAMLKAVTPALKKAGKAFGKSGRFGKLGKFARKSQARIAKIRKNAQFKKLAKLSRGQYNSKLDNKVKSKFAKEFKKQFKKVLDENKKTSGIGQITDFKSQTSKILESYGITLPKRDNKKKSTPEAKIDEYINIINKCTSSAKSVKERIAELKARIADLKLERQKYIPDDFELNNELLRIDGEIEKANEEIAKIDHDLDGIKLLNLEKNKNLKDKIKQLNDSRYSYITQIASLKDQKNELLESRSSNKEKVFEIDQQIAELQNELSEAEKELGSLEAQKEVADLKAKEESMKIPRTINEVFELVWRLFDIINLDKNEIIRAIQETSASSNELAKDNLDANVQIAKETNENNLKNQENKETSDDKSEDTKSDEDKEEQEKQTNESGKGLASLLGFIGDIINIVSSLFIGTWEFVAALVIGGIGLVVAYWDKVKAWVSEAWDTLTGWIDIGISKISGFISWVVDGVKNIFNDIIYGLKEGIHSAVSFLPDWVTNKIDKLIGYEEYSLTKDTPIDTNTLFKDAEDSKKDLDSQVEGKKITSLIQDNDIIKENANEMANQIFGASDELNNIDTSTTSNEDTSISNVTNNVTNDNSMTVNKEEVNEILTNTSNNESNVEGSSESSENTENTDIKDLVNKSETNQTNTANATDSTVNDSITSNKNFYQFKDAKSGVFTVPESQVMMITPDNSDYSKNLIKNASTNMFFTKDVLSSNTVGGVTNPINYNMITNTSTPDTSLSDKLEEVRNELRAVKSTVNTSMTENTKSFKELSEKQASSQGRDTFTIIEHEKIKNHDELYDRHESY